MRDYVGAYIYVCTAYHDRRICVKITFSTTTASTKSFKKNLKHILVNKLDYNLKAIVTTTIVSGYGTHSTAYATTTTTSDGRLRTSTIAVSNPLLLP